MPPPPPQPMNVRVVVLWVEVFYFARMQEACQDILPLQCLLSGSFVHFSQSPRQEKTATQASFGGGWYTLQR